MRDSDKSNFSISKRKSIRILEKILVKNLHFTKKLFIIIFKEFRNYAVQYQNTKKELTNGKKEGI